ncbi:MAG: hypothetical protein CSA05_01755 [Bacteroidia bacterium]|nr:MAG: hypothetical protein CSA05_01755 [Bacteroidia bacterium]
MNNTTIIDPKFDRTKTLQYHISIQLSLDGYALCILDTSENKYLVLKYEIFSKRFTLRQPAMADQFYAKIKEILKEDEFLNNNFKSVKFIYQTSKSTLVPDELFEITKLKSYFTFNHKLELFESINYNKIDSIKAYNIFTLPSFLTTILINKYKNIEFYHQLSPFINTIFSKSQKFRNTSNQKKVYVNVADTFFDIYVADTQKLYLYNNFHYKTEEDFAYYILNTFEQQGLNPDFHQLNISGKNISLNSPEYNLAKKYIKRIKFLKLNTLFKYSDKMNQIPEHSFVNLFNLYSCA